MKNLFFNYSLAALCLCAFWSLTAVAQDTGQAKSTISILLETRRQWNAADSNHDGQLSAEEAQSLAAANLSHRQRVQDRYDQDRDGNISEAELDLVQSEQIEELERLHMKQFSSLDKNGNGSCDADERTLYRHTQISEKLERYSKRQQGDAALPPAQKEMETALLQLADRNGNGRLDDHEKIRYESAIERYQEQATAAEDAEVLSWLQRYDRNDNSTLDNDELQLLLQSEEVKFQVHTEIQRSLNREDRVLLPLQADN